MGICKIFFLFHAKHLLKVKAKYENVNFAFLDIYTPTKGVDIMSFFFYINVQCDTVKIVVMMSICFYVGIFTCTENPLPTGSDS